MNLPQSFKVKASKTFKENALFILELYSLGINNNYFQSPLDLIEDINKHCNVYGFIITKGQITFYDSFHTKNFSDSSFKEFNIADFEGNEEDNLKTFNDYSKNKISVIKSLLKDLSNADPLDFSLHNIQELEHLVSKFKPKLKTVKISKKKPRKRITGRFETREELVEFICNKYHNTTLNIASIARFAEISETSTANILNDDEGKEWLSKNKKQY